MARRTKPRNNIRESTSRHRNRSDIGKRPEAVGWPADGQRFDHFVTAQWIDHVRGVATDPDKEGMKRHLAEGCDSCAHLVALANRIWKTSAGDRTVPEALVESAKAVFQERRSFAQATDLQSMQRDAESPGSIPVRALPPSA
jgi:hypothetical protein